MHEFQDLIQRVKECYKCPRLKNKTGVLGHQNGDLDAEVFFIGEAPGRHGCEKTRIPFKGDQSGDRFEEFLELINLDRSEVFITNAVLCNPLDKDKNNRKPNSEEIKNCSKHLKNQIEIVDPEIIATIGKTALKALNQIKNPKIQLKKHVGKIKEWKKHKIVPLYHTSPITKVHRPTEKQKQDWKKLNRKRK